MAGPSSSHKIGRAIAIGHKLAAIRASHDANHLSKQAWLTKCLEMAGCDKAELEHIRQRLEQCKHLAAEVAILVELMVQRGQAEPFLSTIFEQGERFPVAYAERLNADLTPQQCSAAASWMVAERRPLELFGQLESWAELAAMTNPLEAELRDLDKSLADTVLAKQLGWQDGRPRLRYNGVTVLIEQGTCERLATEFAEAAMRQPVDIAA